MGERFFNLYPSGATGPEWDTREQADGLAQLSRVALIRVVPKAPDTLPGIMGENTLLGIACHACGASASCMVDLFCMSCGWEEGGPGDYGFIEMGDRAFCPVELGDTK